MKGIRKTMKKKFKTLIQINFMILLLTIFSACTNSKIADSSIVDASEIADNIAESTENQNEIENTLKTEKANVEEQSVGKKEYKLLEQSFGRIKVENDLGVKWYGPGWVQMETGEIMQIVSAWQKTAANTILALRGDGTVLSSSPIDFKGYVSEEKRNPIIYQTEEFHDMISISANSMSIAGVNQSKKIQFNFPQDSAEEFQERNRDVYQTREWTNIIHFSSGILSNIGLKEDGSILLTTMYGPMDDINTSPKFLEIFSQTSQWREEMDEWKNIQFLDIQQTNYYTAGLKEDGTVVVSIFQNNDRLSEQERMKNGYTGYSGQDLVQDWTDIVMISASLEYLLGLKSDGTVVSTPIVGQKQYNESYDFGQEKVSNWRDIVSISAGQSRAVGLTKDGTVVVIPENIVSVQTANWKDIVLVETTPSDIIGVQKDGTVLTTYIPEFIEQNISSARFIRLWDNMLKPTKTVAQYIEEQNALIQKIEANQSDSVSLEDLIEQEMEIEIERIMEENKVNKSAN